MLTILMRVTLTDNPPTRPLNTYETASNENGGSYRTFLSNFISTYSGLCFLRATLSWYTFPYGRETR